MRLRVFLVVLCSTVALSGALATAPVASAQGNPNLFPHVDCVYHNPTGGLTAAFGYTNLTTDTLVVDVGPTNAMTPLPIDRGQPTLFEPGSHERVLSVDFEDGAFLTWFLVGHFATADATTNPCYRLTFRGAWDSDLTYLAGDVVRDANSAAWVARKESRNSQPSVPSTDWELLAGNPQPAFASTQAYTFGKKDMTVVQDANVTPSSTIIVQYVDGAGKVPTSVENVTNGSFTATGTADKSFRYVVYP